MYPGASGPGDGGLTVVVPCYNEAENVAAAYQEIVSELRDYDLELLFVDDGSTDRTLEIVRELAAADPRVQYLSFSRNFGIEAAFSAGYRYASRPWVLHVDADLQFPGTEAHKLIAASGGMDAVFGVRETRDDPLVRRLGAAGYHLIARRMLGIEIPPGATTFRLVRTGLARRIVDLRLGTPYFLATLPRLTDRYTAVAVSHRGRLRGESKMSLRWLTGHAIGLFFGFSTRLPAVAAGAATVAAVLALVTAGAALFGAFGAVGPVGAAGQRAGTAMLFALVAVVLVALGAMLRYLVTVGAGQPRPRLFYVREASVPVASEDRLLPEPAGAPEDQGAR